MKFSLQIPPSGLITAAIIIVLSVLIVYSNNYTNGFVFDDNDAIIENSQIKTLSISSLLHLNPDASISGRPVVALSFALNYALGGLDVRGYHLINNLIHLLAALVLFSLVRTTLLLPRFAGNYGAGANRYALLVALLWAVHPLQTESVTYIVSRTESLMGLFYLSTLFFAARGFRAEQPRPWFTAAMTTCVLGMGSKEVMVSAPLLVLLYDILFVAGSLREALRQRRGFYCALALSWLVLVYYQIGLPHGGGISFIDPDLSVLDYLRTQMTVIVHYLRLVFWPHPLVMDSQDWPIVREFSPVLILPLLLLGSMAAATIIGLRQKAWWSLPGVAFFAILAPTSSIIPLFGEIVSERRMYLPLAAVIILLVFVADVLWRHLADRLPADRNFLRTLPLVTAGLIIIALGALSWNRNLDYRSELTIWADTVAKRPANPRAQRNLGKILLLEGRHAEAAHHLAEAARYYPASYGKKNLADIYSNLGTALSYLGNFQEAVAMHDKSLELLPESALLHHRLGNTYLRANDLDNAASAFRQAITFDPQYLPSYGNLGLIFAQQGGTASAEHIFKKMLELDEKDSGAYLIYGDFLTGQGRFVEAAALYRRGLSVGITDVRLSRNLEDILSEHPEAEGPQGR